MATASENTVSNDFCSTFLDSIGLFDCSLPGVKMLLQKELVLLREHVVIYVSVVVSQNEREKIMNISCQKIDVN